MTDELIYRTAVTITSLATGITHTRVVPIAKDVLTEWRKGDRLIQEIAPYLSADDAEFLISGITPEEWENMDLDD
jgi:hypothetical protein